jgi:hypothetical protein
MSVVVGSEQVSERDREMVRLYEAGELTLAEIGQRFGVSRQRVHQVLRRAGVRTRRCWPPRRARRLEGEVGADVGESVALGIEQAARGEGEVVGEAELGGPEAV